MATGKSEEKNLDMIYQNNMFSIPDENFQHCSVDG